MSRKSKQIPYKSIIAIYCEGDSEKRYFEMLKRKYHSANVHTAKISVDSVGVSGLELLKKAAAKIEKLPKNKKIEKAYVVFDHDAFSENELRDCDAFAKAHNITILFSSINLEIWILMHFEPVFKSYSASELNSRLSGKDYFNTDYSAFKGQDYGPYLFDRVKIAKEHADLLKEKSTDPWYKRDPYTNINQYLAEIFSTTSF